MGFQAKKCKSRIGQVDSREKRMQVSGEVSRPRARELATPLFKTEGNNKLSTDFKPAPFTVVQTTGTKVTLRNMVGVQLNRNTAFVKKYNEHNDVANGNGDHVEQEIYMVQQVEEPGQSRISETFLVEKQEISRSALRNLAKRDASRKRMSSSFYRQW